MEILSVKNLSKTFDGFSLKDISFSLESGYIMGLIGRNGAGKTTTLKALLNLIHVDSGEIKLLGHDIFSDELFCKQHIGWVSGGFDYYHKKKLCAITNVVKKFYDNWDEKTYVSLMHKFNLNPDKRVDQLSAGMKVKYALTLALSHNAQLLILDEPTSGLDPVSRDEIIDIFRDIIEDGNRSILFSTHIISDLEKCADYITYIKDGKMIACDDMLSFMDSYRLISFKKDDLEKYADRLIGYRKNAFGVIGLIPRDKLTNDDTAEVAPADLESIMIYFEKENNSHEQAFV